MIKKLLVFEAPDVAQKALLRETRLTLLSVAAGR